MNEALLTEAGQRIGWTLVHSVWQFSVIAVVLAVSLRLLRGRSPHLRYGFMLAALSLMSVAPVVTFVVVETNGMSTDSADAWIDAMSEDDRSLINDGFSAPLPNQSLLSEQQSSAAELPGSSIAAGMPATGNRLFADLMATTQNCIRRWMNFILAGWLLGMLVLSIRPLIGWRATRQLRSRGRSSVPSAITTATERVAKLLKIRRAIEVTESSQVDVPTVIGWVKPLVLLPASAISGLSTEQLEAVIAHELAHVRRHDYLVNLHQLAMETVFFYHPAVWWVSHRMRVEREECCDDIAVHMTGDRVGYAKVLVWLEESRTQPTAATLGMASDGGSLLGRVRRLVSTPSQTASIGPLAITVALALVIGTGWLLTIGANDSSAQEAQDNKFEWTNGKIATDGFVVTYDQLVALIAVRPHQATADKAWRSNGTAFEQTPDLPSMPYNETTREMTGVDLLFFVDAVGPNRRPIYRMPGMKHTFPTRDQGMDWVIAVPPENAKTTTVTIGIPDEEWGPWKKVNTKGESIEAVVLSPRLQESYAAIKPYEILARAENRVLFRWSHDREQRDLASKEVVAVDKSGVRHRWYGATLWDDENDVTRDADVFDLPLSQIDHFEYRLRPYRHWTTFNNVALKPNQTTDVRVHTRTVEIPKAGDKATYRGRIVLPDGSPSQTEGYMYISAQSERRGYFGTVAKVGNQFDFQSLPGKVFITHFPDGYAPTWTQPMDVAAGDIVEGIVLKLKRGFDIQIEIHDRAGNPVPNATLVAHPMINGSSNGPVRKHAADKSGRVSLSHLAETKYTFSVEAAGFEELRTEPMEIAKDKVVRLEMQQAAVTKGIIRDSEGLPAAGAKLRAKTEVRSNGATNTLFDTDGDTLFGKVLAETDMDGRFTLNELSKGSRYLFIIEGADGSRMLYRDFRAGQENVKIRLSARRDLNIQIQGDVEALFKAGTDPYVDVSQHLPLTLEDFTSLDQAGERVPVENTETGGNAIIRGLVFDPEVELSKQTVRLTLGMNPQRIKDFQLSNDQVTTVQWKIGILAPRQSSNAAIIRNWANRAIGLEEWGRLTQLAKLLAGEGEYDDALGLLSKAPLGKSKDGKLSAKFYDKTVSDICEIALQHDRLDVAERILDQLTDTEEQTLSGVKIRHQVGGIRLAILKYHVSKGQIDEAIAYLNSQPTGTHPNMVHRVASDLPRLGHGDHVESFWRRLTDPKIRGICEHHLANAYYHFDEPDKIWRLADEIAKTRPDDLIAEVQRRNTAMVYYAKTLPKRFSERLPAYLDKIQQLPDAEQTRYWKDLALSAAKAKRYDLVAELSSTVPLLLQSQSRFMDLSGTDRHPVLYAIAELQKQHQFDQAFSIIDAVEDDAIVIAALARLANLALSDDEIDQHAESYQQIVNRFTNAYEQFAAKNNEQTVRDVSRKLPEMLNIHLRRIANPLLSPDDVAYLDRDLLHSSGEHVDLLIEQGKISDLVRHTEGLLQDGNLQEAKWIVTKIATAGRADAFERFRVQVKQLFDANESSESISTYRRFLAHSALSAYSAGQRELCYEIFMKLDRNWMSPSMVSRVASQARANGDMEFLRRMESSPSPLMREAALSALTLHHVLAGDMEAAEQVAETFDREFGNGNEKWSIYRRITHKNNVKDPSRRIAATQLALQHVSIDSYDYAAIAREHAKLLGLLYPGKPVPADWLAKLNSNPKLRLQVELEHAYGS